MSLRPQMEDRVGGLWAAGLTLFVFAVIAGSVWWAWWILRHRAPAGFEIAWRGARTRAERTAPSLGGVLQGPIGEQPEVGRQGQRVRLTTYGWVDARRGLVRIPVERAMALLAARGIGGTAPLPGGATVFPRAPRPLPPTGPPVGGARPLPAGGLAGGAPEVAPPPGGTPPAGRAPELEGARAGGAEAGGHRPPAGGGG